MRTCSVTRTPSQVKADHIPAEMMETHIMGLFKVALDSYSHVLPYHLPQTGEQWAELIEKTYDCSSDSVAAVRNRMVVAAVRYALPDIPKDLL